MNHRSLGFTLVELMVALVIGLLVLAGAIQLFVTSKRVFGEIEVLGARQEAIRYIPNRMSADVRTSLGVQVVEDEEEGLPESFLSSAVCQLPERFKALSMVYADGGEASRLNDPYCSSGDLERIVYVFPKPLEGESISEPIFSCHLCSSGSGWVVSDIMSDVSMSVTESVVQGRVASVAFDMDLSGMGGGFSVNEFRFSVTPRAEVVRALEEFSPSGN